MLAILVCAWSSAALAEPKFPPLTGRVVDDAHILSPQTAQKLDADLAGLEARTGHQLVVATLPDLQGYDIADYGYQLGRAWGVGRKGQNDGAVFIVAPKERKVRIEVGYGLEPVLTDALSSVILQQKVLPRFRDGQMEQGVVDGTEAIVQQLDLPEDQAKAQVAQAAQIQQQQQQQGRGGGMPFGLVIAVVVIFWVLSSRLRGFGGGWWLLPMLFSGGGRGGRDGWGGGSGGGFSGGGGSFGGGGSSGSW